MAVIEVDSKESTMPDSSVIAGEASLLGIQSSCAIQKVVDEAGAIGAPVFVADFDRAIDGVVRDFLARHTIRDKFDLLMTAHDDVGIGAATTLSSVIDEGLANVVKMNIRNLRRSMILHLYEGRVGAVLAEADAVLELMVAAGVNDALPHEVEEFRDLHAGFLSGELDRRGCTLLVMGAADILVPGVEIEDKVLEARVAAILDLSHDMVRAYHCGETAFLDQMEAEFPKSQAVRRRSAS